MQAFKDSGLFILLRNIHYPELILVFVVSLFLALSLDSLAYQAAFLILVIFSAVLFFISTQHKRSILFDSLALFALSLNLGLLQLEYIPSLCLWLVFVYRISLINNKNLIAPISIAAFSIIAISVLTLRATSTALNVLLSEEKRLYLSMLAIIASGLVLFHQTWYAIQKIQALTEEVNKNDARVRTLVERANKMSRFLPPQVWQPILHQNKAITTTNQRRKLTILFSDIAGFTELSDTISPDHLANILNTYFDRMTKITQKYGATLDKFIGDGMLCFFGDSPNSNERQEAILCASMALEMRREMQVLRQQWRLLGFDGLYVRIGINTGYCYVGNFGSNNRLAYTIVGKEANFASRLESSAQPGQILISESTYNLISHKHNCQLIGVIKVKGLQKPAKVWEVLDPKQGDTQNYENWLDYQLPGFNLHLNFKDMRNYEKRTIINHLNHALDLLDKKQINVNDD